MRTPKIETLYRLITFLHNHYPELPVDFFKPLEKSPINSNAWLSGMWDADGNFNINISRAKKRATGFRVQINARLELRTTYHNSANKFIGNISYRDIMQRVADYFGVNVYDRKRLLFGKMRYSYIVMSSTFATNAAAASYFSRFPLFFSFSLIF